MKEIVCNICKKTTKISDNRLSTRCDKCREIFMTKTIRTRIYNDKTIIKYSCCDCNKELKRYKDNILYNKRCKKCTTKNDKLYANKINKDYIELKKILEKKETKDVIIGNEKSNNPIWNSIIKRKQYATKKQKDIIKEKLNME